MATISACYSEESTVKNVHLGARVSKLKMPKEINLDKFGSQFDPHIFFPVLKVVIIKHPILLVIVCCYPFSLPQGKPA